MTGLSTASPLRLTRPRPGVLVATKSRFWHAFELVSVLAALVTAYVYFLGVPTDAADVVDRFRRFVGDQPFRWLVLLFPVVWIVRSARSIPVLLRGESFTFDGGQRVVLKNGERVAPFDRIDTIQLRTIGSDPPDYRLSLLLQGGDKISIDHGSNLNHIGEIADAMADIIGKPVVRR